MDGWLAHRLHLPRPFLVCFHHCLSVLRQQLQNLLDRPPLQSFHQVKSLHSITLVFELEDGTNFGEAGGDPNNQEVQPTEIFFNELEVPFRYENSLLFITVDLPALESRVECLDLSLDLSERKSLGNLVYFGLFSFEDTLTEQ